MPKLNMDSVNDVEWLPTHPVIPEMETDEDEMETITASEVLPLDDFKDDLETDLKDDQHSIIPISLDLGSVTSMSSIDILEVEPFVSSDLDYEIDSNLDTDTDEGPQDVQNMSSEPESESDMDFLPNNAYNTKCSALPNSTRGFTQFDISPKQQ